VRKGFLDTQEFGSHMYDGLMETLSSAKKERLKRLKTMAEKAQASVSSRSGEQQTEPKKELFGKMAVVEDIFMGEVAVEGTEMERDQFLSDFNRLTAGNGTGYIQAVQALPADIRAGGVRWLDRVVATLCGKVAGAVPSLSLFGE
jgi:hypothetical protein